MKTTGTHLQFIKCTNYDDDYCVIMINIAYTEVLYSNQNHKTDLKKNVISCTLIKHLNYRVTKVS